MQLPSNKIGGLFLVVVIAVVTIIGGDVFFKNSKQGDEPEIVDADLVLRRNTTNESAIDTDGDGLLDWQESLYGSSPDSFDTDGDGTSDGDEILAGRDPSVAGPDDSLINSGTLLNTDFDVAGFTPGSLTDFFSKDLFTNYLNLKKSNSLTPNSSDEIANHLAAQIETGITVEIKYSKYDLNIVESTNEALTKYGKEVAIIGIDYMKQVDTLRLLEDEEYLIKAGDKYTQYAEVLSGIEVPDVASNVHLDIVNNHYNNGVSTRELSEYETDPLKTLLAVRKIQEIYNNENTLYRLLKTYFVDNDIIFEDTQISRFWNLYK